MTAPDNHHHTSDTTSKAILALSLAAFGSGLSQRITDPLLPRLASEFGLQLGTASWVITCFTLSYALCQLLFGPVGDRYGKYIVIGWSCIGSAVVSLLCSLAPNFALLLVARALVGSMVAALIPLAMAWIGDVVPYERRQSVLAQFLIGQILGVSAGQLLGGLSADYLGWRVPFVLIAAVFAAAAWQLFKMRRKLPAHALAVQPREGHVLRHLWWEFSQVLAQPWARVVLVTVMLEGALVFGSFAFFAAHLHRVLGISLAAAGATVMLFGAGGFLFASTSRHFVVRLRETGLARGGGLIMTISLGLIAAAPNLWLVALACLTMGLAFYMLHTTLQTNATQMAPERRGAAVSAFAFCYFLGQSIGIATAGALVGRIGTAGVIFTSALGVVIVALNFARLKRSQLLANQR